MVRGRDAPVLVTGADADWLGRAPKSLRLWGRDDLEVVPGVTLMQAGGHFKGSAAVHWTARDGRGVLLSGDTIMANPDRTSVSFMRSYPNRLPLSGAVALRIAAFVTRFDFDRLYNNFTGVIPTDAAHIVRRSAQRHADWVNGEFDHLT